MANGGGEGYGMIACDKNGQVQNANEISCKACANRCYKGGTCYLAGDGYDHQRVSETDGTCAD